MKIFCFNYGCHEKIIRKAFAILTNSSTDTYKNNKNIKNFFHCSEAGPVDSRECPRTLYINTVRYEIS